MKRRSGFTLIELLVVIAIILVLAAILFPVFAAAKKAATKSACSSNMKQLALAIQNYATDNAGKVVPAMNFAGSAQPYNTPMPPSYPVRMQRYMKSVAGLVRCPLISESLLIKDPYFKNLASNSSRVTYGINWRFECGGALCGPDPNREPMPPSGFRGVTQTLDAPSQPAKTVLMIETQDKAQWAGDAASAAPNDLATEVAGGNLTPFGDWKGVAPAPTRNWMAAIRMFDYPMVPFGHNGCNVALADGHVQFIRAPKLASDNKTPTYSTIGRAGLTWWQLPEGTNPGTEPAGSHPVGQ